MIPNVPWTGHVLITIVDLHVKMLVDKMLNARHGTMELFVLVLQDMSEIPLQHVDHRAGLELDFQDSDDT